MSQPAHKTWGEGRVQIKAQWPSIETMLQAGHSVSFIHRELKDKGLITIGRYQFSLHIKNKATTFSHKPSLPPQPSRQRLTAPPAYEGRGAVSSTAKPQTFQHDPRPLKDYFAKGAGS